MPNIVKDNVTVFTTDDIKRLGVKKVMDEAFKIASNNTNGVHISYDLDVIDPILAPGVSVPAKDGINLDEAFEIVDELINNKEIIKSMDLVEYNPTKDKDDITKNIAIDILKKVIKNFS
jgi:arginase